MAVIAALGEALIDFIADTPEAEIGEVERFVVRPGGAPANVAVACARLGAHAAFLGKVGDDPFGRKLESVLRSEDVDVRGLRFDASARTALAFVSLGPGGEREFSFYRNPSADMLYHQGEVDHEVVASATILHFGSISLIDEPARGATLAAIEAAREAGAMISYDPNLRLPLWPGEEEARDALMLGWERAGVIKVSEEELAFLTGGSDLAAARSLMTPGVELLIVTRGSQGADYLTADYHGHVKGFQVEAVDTTGAGDAFMASVLVRLQAKPDLLNQPDGLRRSVRYANACAALCVSKRGAMAGLPRRAELQAFLESHPE